MSSRQIPFAGASVLLAALGLVALAPGAGAVARFCTRTDVPLRTNSPHAIVAADFYGADGIPDLAITFGGSKRVSLWRNNGMGTFVETDVLEPPVPDTGISSLASDAAAIVAADFNDDGLPDIAGTNRTALRYFAYLNPGVPGGWGAPASPDARRGNGTDIIAVNWDADAALDLVVVTEAGAVGIAVGETDGGGLPTGSWGSLQRFSTTAQVGVFNDVKVANFLNVPGESAVTPDVLAVDNQYGQLVIWPGDATFRGYVLSAAASLVLVPVRDGAGARLSPIEAFVEDWTGDGWPDALVVTSEGVLLFYPSTATAAVFGPPVRVDLVANLSLGARPPTEWTAALLVDITGDGTRDLVIADAGEPTADRGFNWITTIPGLPGGGPPTFDGAASAQRHYAMGNMSALRPGSIVTADIDGDLDLDLIVLHGDQNAMTVLRNDGSGVFDAPPSYPVGATQPRTAVGGRVDATGREVVAIGCASTADPLLRTVIVFPGTGPDTVGPARILTPPGADQPSELRIASVNSADDANADILGTFTSDQFLWRGTGTGTFGSPSSSGGAPGRIALADMLGDSALDLAVVERSPADRVRTFEGDGRGGFTLRQSYPLVLGGSAITAGRYFGGAQPDLVVAGVDSFSRPGLYLFPWNDGAGAHDNPTFVPSDDFGLGGTSFAFLFSEDLDGGGQELVGITPSGDGFVLRPQGGTFVLDLASAPITFGGSARAAIVRDLTGDGLLDIAVAEASVIRIREGRPGALFEPVVTLLANISTEGLAAADLDGDGRPELIAVSSRTADFTVFCNQSLGSLRLSVGRPGVGREISWLDQGAGATYQLASGSINALWVNRDLRDATCLPAPVGTTYADARPLPAPAPPTDRGGYYYLVKCQGGDCTEPDFGSTSDGRPRFGPGSPGTVPDPCP